MLFKEKYLKLENKEPKKFEQTMTNHEKRITKNEEEVKMLKNTEKECPEKRFKCNKCKCTNCKQRVKNSNMKCLYASMYDPHTCLNYKLLLLV